MDPATAANTAVYSLNPSKNMALQVYNDSTDVYVNIVSRISKRNQEGTYTHEPRKILFSYKQFSEIVVKHMAKGLYIIRSGKADEKVLLDNRTPGGMVISIVSSNDQLALDVRYYLNHSPEMDKKTYAEFLKKNDSPQPLTSYFSTSGARLSEGDLENLLLALPSVAEDYEKHRVYLESFGKKREAQKRSLNQFVSGLPDDSPFKRAKSELIKVFNLDN